MRRNTIGAVLIVAATVVGCKTITEEMPEGQGNNPNGPNPAPVPVVVVPVPIPTPPPATPPPAPPPNQPAPPADGPNAPPPNNNPGGGDVPDNTNPVAKLTAKLYFVECFGQIVDPPAPVGCRIHLDVTPTDASNKHTQARGTPRWTYTNMSIIGVSGNSPYNPVLDARAAGDLDCWAEVDGIRSNTVHISIR
jgi:hypothetical protein